jgi:transcriptional regulator NrdR family protein
MIACLQCGGDTGVLITRAIGPFRTRRRRQCHRCNHRFGTIEMPATEHIEPGADYVAIPRQKLERLQLAAALLRGDVLQEGDLP